MWSSIKSEYWGLKSYSEVDALQLQLSKSIGSNEVSILGGEHPGVITLGKRASPEQDVKVHNGLPVVFTDRGGQATLHSPGQLVIYPIASVRSWGVRPWVRFLLQVSARAFESYGVRVDSGLDNSGLFVKGRKLASLGLRIENGVSRHGLALNIANDLSLFQQIRVCGASHQAMIRAHEINPHINLEDFFASWVREFRSSAEALKKERVGVNEGRYVSQPMDTPEKTISINSIV